MKKKIGLLCLVLLVIVAVAILPAVYAEEMTEARLTVSTSVGDTVYSGSLDEMAEKLNSLMPAAEATNYKLELLVDASLTKQIKLVGGGSESVSILLGGYSVDATALNEAALAVNGIRGLKLEGGFSTDSVEGEILVSTALLSVAPSTTAPDIELCDIVVGCNNAAETAITAGGGELMLRNVNMVYSTDASAPTATLVSVLDTELTLVGSSIIDGKTAPGAVTGIYATGSSVVRLEGSRISTDVAYRMDEGTTLTAIDTALHGNDAVFAGSGVANLGGVQLSGAAILGESATKENVRLWYGTGSTLISAADPSDSLTVSTARAALSEISTGTWSLVPTGTSYSAGAAILTVFADGAEPVETYYSGSSKNTVINAILAGSAVTDVKTAAIVAMLADYSHNSTQTALFGTSHTGTVSLFIDFNGHTMTKTEKGANAFRTSAGSFRMSIDGADALGNLGTFSNEVSNGTLLQTVCNDDSVLRVSDINIIYKDMAGYINGSKFSSPSPMLQLADARSYLEGVKLAYTGEMYGNFYTNDADNAASLAAIGHTLNPESFTNTMVTIQSTGRAVIKNCKFDGTNTAGVKTLGVSGSGASQVVYVTGAEATGLSSFVSTAGKACVADSRIDASSTPYKCSSDGTVTVTDTITTIPSVKLATGNVIFNYGDGTSRVITDASSFSGDQSFEDGYVFVYSSDESAYILESSADFTSVKLGDIFTDGVVLQAGKPVDIYGACATDGNTVTVTVAGASKSTVVTDGKWRVTFDPLDYATDITITVVEEGLKYGTTTVNDVDIGEVFVMSGQSNSVYGAYKMEDYDAYLALADNYDNIKCLSMSQSQSMLPKSGLSLKWYEVNSSTLGRDDRYTGISAVAYVMATRLAVELPKGVTIAIIDTNFNGSTVEAWASPEMIEKYDSTNYNIYKKHYDYYVENGTYPTEEQAKALGFGDVYVTSGKLYQQMSCACYNAMIAPIKGFAARGAIWYQGEGNSSSVGADKDGYTAPFNAVRATFREAFLDDELPFFVIQLPAHMSNFAYYRELQYNLAAADANTYIVNSGIAGAAFTEKEMQNTDPGENMVHYARKSPLGNALADTVLEKLFFKDEKIAAPEILSCVREGIAIRLTLDRDFTLLYGNKIVGFEIAGADGVFKSAVATYEGRTITLMASGISNPKYVRYAHSYSVLELEDGTEFDFNKNAAAFNWNEGTGVVTIVVNGGETYEFNVSDTIVVRSHLNGNIVATNGNTLPAFSITVD